MAQDDIELGVVVPLFNEEGNVGTLHDRLTKALIGVGLAYEVVFVDDGSRDGTANRLQEIASNDRAVSVVRLSRNFGHQGAVSAGLSFVRGRAVVVMDGDLQDPPEVIPGFVKRWREGFDVVYAVRRGRKEGPLRRAGYFTFYRLLNAISDLEIPLDSGDFSLMDRKVVDVLNALPERARFVRGLRTFVGFRQTGHDYERAARGSGHSKYSMGRLMRLAMDGLISFSSYPLRLVSYLGITTALAAAGLIVWVLVDALHNQTAPRGWASTLAVVLFIGAIQMIALGIIGEYLRLIFLETKGRPTYVVDSYHRAPGHHGSG